MPIEAFGPNIGFRTEPLLYPDTGAATAGGSSPKPEIITPEAFRFFIPEYESGRLLTDKVILITGVGRKNGIGKAIATEFGGQGARLLLTATESSADEGEALAEELRGSGVEAHWIAARLNEAGQPERLVEEAVNKFGRLDIVVANHGIRIDAGIMDLSVEDFEKVMAVNFYGTLRLAKAALPVMSIQTPKGGVFQATTSISKDGYMGQGPYSSSKAAEHGLLGVIAQEGRFMKIRANEVAPGLVEGTGVTEDLTPKQIGRILKDAGMPESITQQDVAMAHLYFAAETTGKLTGKSMDVLYRGQVQPA